MGYVNIAGRRLMSVPCKGGGNSHAYVKGRTPEIEARSSQCANNNRVPIIVSGSLDGMPRDDERRSLSQLHKTLALLGVVIILCVPSAALHV